MKTVSIDISSVIESFRNQLIHLLYDIIISNGGELTFHKEQVDIIFDSLRLGTEVFGTVKPLSLTAVKDTPDTVIFHYCIPEWCEDNDYYVDYDLGGVETIVVEALNEFSCDELFNIISAI